MTLRKINLKDLASNKLEDIKSKIKSMSKSGKISVSLPKKISLSKKKVAGYPKFEIYPARTLTKLPTTIDKEKGMIYHLIKPYAYVSIRPEKDGLFSYNIVEPRLTDNEKHILEKIKEGMIQVVDASFESIKKDDSLLEFLENNVQWLLKEYGFHLKEQEYLQIMYYVFRDFVGMNELEPIMHDSYIEDVGCDGINIPVYVVHQKYGSLKTNIEWSDSKTLKDFITKIAQRCDRYVSYAEPLLDGTLPDGTRVQATIADDVTTKGPTFSLRKFREIPFTPIDLIKLGTISVEMTAYLWYIIEHGANILISGGVATGKTSMLNSLSIFIPPQAKIISIEDTRELNLPHENWIPGVSRTGYGATGLGQITMFDLLKESFRQNPDYLIVGEIRGVEAYVMFQSMASGHPSMSTIHAGSVDDVLKRLQTKPISLSPGLLDSLDMVIIMVHAREKGKSARRVKEVVEIESVNAKTGTAETSKTFKWVPFEDKFNYTGSSQILKKISEEKGIQMDNIKKEIEVRKKVLNWMLENNLTNMGEVAKYIHDYYKSPENFESLKAAKENERISA